MLARYLRFLRAPTYIYQNQPVRWGELGTLLLLYLVIAFALSPLLQVLADRFGLEHALEDAETLELVLAVALIPVTEEIIFRLWLRVSRSTLFAAAFLVFFVGILLLPLSHWGAVLLMAMSVSLLVATLMGHEAAIARAVAHHFGAFFYGSAVVFALAHITNYVPLNAQTLLLAPVLVLPQFIMGTVLGYVRVRYGIGYAILLHVVVNAVFFAVIDFFPT